MSLHANALLIEKSKNWEIRTLKCPTIEKPRNWTENWNILKLENLEIGKFERWKI